VRYRVLITTLVFTGVVNLITAQQFHYKTGKVLAGSKPGFIYWQPGIFNGYQANYGTLLVNEQPGNLNTKLIAIPVIHIRAQFGKINSLPVYVLHGGPGESNLRTELIIPEILKNHDIIIMGYRGADGSVILNGLPDSCLFCNYSEPGKQFPNPFLPIINRYMAAVATTTAYQQGYCTGALVSDLFTLTRAMQHDTIAILAYSYGTMVAQLCVRQYPQLIKQMALIGARPVSKATFDQWPLSSLYTIMYEHYTGQCLNLPKHSALIDAFCKHYNVSRALFNLFVFSSLYSQNASLGYFGCFGTENPQTCLKDMYDKFYRYFPGKVFLADMVLKKQDLAVWYSALPDSNLFSQMALSLNQWYFPYQSADSTPLIVPPFNGPVLIVNGEFDVAAPPVLAQTQLLPPWPQAKLYNMAKTTHLDYFLLQKPLTDSLVISFIE
jgi:pimeloyl-ACP methyl ester carboxylesterase